MENFIFCAVIFFIYDVEKIDPVAPAEQMIKTGFALQPNKNQCWLLFPSISVLKYPKFRISKTIVFQFQELAP